MQVKDDGGDEDGDDGKSLDSRYDFRAESPMFADGLPQEWESGRRD